MNCEFEPLINEDDEDPINKDDEDPINKTIPPPPLHTVLLGPVNHLFKQLLKTYPKILKISSKLCSQRPKYDGRNFEGKSPWLSPIPLILSPKYPLIDDDPFPQVISVNKAK